MPATADRPKADRTILPLLSRGPLLQERERHYRKGSRTRGRPKAEGGGGGSEVPARCSSTVQADLTRGKREREGSPVHQEVRTRRTETGSRFFECRPYRPSNSGESAIPESRATRATTSPIARDCDCVLTMERGLPTVQIAKRSASRSAG